jgi:hypothetical protein
VRAPNIRLERPQAQSLSVSAGRRFHAWVERHIVSYDPFDTADVQQPRSKLKISISTEIALTVLLMSAFVLYVTGIVALWSWFAG